MRRFLAKTLLFAASYIGIVCVLFVVVFLHLPPVYSDGYTASILDKVARLESIHEPKIILVGDSNLAFGIKSLLIEKATGMPVVNLGLHGGLGFRFQERAAKYNIGKGDIVVVSTVMYRDQYEFIDHNLVWITIENHLHLYRIVANDILGMIKSFPAYLKRIIKAYREGHKQNTTTTIIVRSAYERAAFNKYGDVAYPRPRLEVEYDAKDVGVQLTQINDTYIGWLNDFNRYCQRRGAHLVIAGHPIPMGQFTADKSLFSAVWQEIKHQLDCPVISNIEDYFYPYSDFYNGGFHLNDRGAIKRTKQLIKDIERAKLVGYTGEYNEYGEGESE